MSALRFSYQSNPRTRRRIHYSDNNPVSRKATRLEQLTKDKQAAALERIRLQEELARMIRGLTVDHLLAQNQAP